MRLAHWLTATGCAVLLAGCTSVSPRTNVIVAYYKVEGTSFQELDRQIALHGPDVPGVGKAIAATSVRMMPDIRHAVLEGLCQVTAARVRVQANVTLPRLAGRAQAARDMRGAFDNIEAYAKLHEAMHVAIADNHAEIAEERIMDVEPAADCTTLRERVVGVFDQTMAEHEAAQAQFDREEQERFARLAREGSKVRKRPEAS